MVIVLELKKNKQSIKYIRDHTSIQMTGYLYIQYHWVQTVSSYDFALGKILILVAHQYKPLSKYVVKFPNNS